MNDIHDMVGAYVLDALGPEEIEVFEAHLAECGACRAEVAELRRVVDVLPLAVDRVEPPVSLKDRLLQEVASESDGPAGLRLVHDDGAPLTRGASRFPWQGFAAAAAAVVLAAGGAWTLGRHSAGNTPSRTALPGNLVQAILDGQVRHVQGTHVPPGVQAAVVQPSTGPAYFVVSGMAAAPAGKVYELWLIRGKQSPLGAGVFAARGASPEVVRMPVTAGGSPTVAVTVEPGPSGSRQPTSTPIMVGTLRA